MSRLSLLFSACLFSLHVLGQPAIHHTYTDQHLQSLRVPVGGLGTGNLLLGGRGNIAHVELFNRPDRQRRLEKTFFAVWVRQGQQAPVAKLLERELFPPYYESTHKYVAGLPRMQQATFTNQFPIQSWAFQDEAIPLNISMEAFSPFVPLDVEASSYPLVAFYWTLANPTNEPVQASIVLSMENPIEGEQILNEFHQNQDVAGVRFVAQEVEDVNFQGEVFMGTTASEVDIQTHGYPGAWRDEGHVFWDDFSDDGRLEVVKESWETTYRPTSYNEGTDRMAAVLVSLELAPGAQKRIPFYLSWYVPKRVFGPAEVFGIEAAANKPFENAYAKRFQDELEALAQFRNEETELHERTQQFADALAASSYPAYVKEALTTQAATLRTHLIQLTGEGNVHGFEGVLQTGWCCPGTCTHVWNYEQTLASLFPSLERKMREIEFLHNTFDNGFQAHRSVIPLGDYWFDGPAAADGQMGSIVRAYRDWKLSGDDAWLAQLWPKIQKALEFAWKGPGTVSEARFKHQERQNPWDPDQIGLLSGRQHNTYDINFFGPTSMTTSLYLAALKASAEMATAMKDKKAARHYQKIYERGAALMADSLWNGAYFIQIIAEDPEETEQPEYEPTKDGSKPIPKYQYGDGCLSDQLLGQYLAYNAGLGYLLDSAKVNKALKAIYTHNFIRPLRDFSNVQRVYGLNEEGGVVLCTWPTGNRPALPFVYSDEIWTGVEYQVAASLMHAGMVSEGLEIVEAVQDRYDGFKRNPFEHDESGVHYARAMASWSVLLALSGVSYDGNKQVLSFDPKLNKERFSTFWSTGTAWGEFTLEGKQAALKVLHGELRLKRFEVVGRGMAQASKGKQLTAGESWRLPLE